MFLTQVACSQISYEKKTAKLMTVWGENLKASDPVLPEYPRPQMVREKWLNLNGIWQFQPAANANEAFPAGKLKREILVPFPVESALSGIMEHHENVWYRRSFTVPSDWNDKRLLLHFGAVDYACEVFINGISVGKHEGGYDAFYFDITESLASGGTQELTVKVNDMTDAKGYPRGKQTLYPGGIMYTSTTGIWQTVWLEAVNKQAYISRIRMVPDIDNATLKLHTEGVGIDGLKLRFKISDNGKEIAVIEENYRSDFYTLNIPKPMKLWSPDNPFLYDMEVSLMSGTEVIDCISTYFGMRKISKQLVDGYYRMMLNNEFLFQIGPLDQGFWPDGIYTAPTDEALRYDIEVVKSLGFNMIRKHIKVEPQRWYYWCDKLGVLVWQDMPSMNSYIDTGKRPVPPQEQKAFRRELEAMVKNHWNSPAIVSWVIFNEWQGAHDEAGLNSLVKTFDDSRLVNIGSGGPDFEIGDIWDWHNYPAPTCPPKRGEQALVCGEYGGIGYYERGHIWEEGNPYETVSSYAQLLEKYSLYADMLIHYKSSRGLNAAVYTEITDVEMELNGFLTYDRKVIKGNVEDIYAVNQRIINEIMSYRDVVPTSEETPQIWKYTTAQPASSWITATFDDSAWNSGKGGFGTINTPGAVVNTVWNTNNIWLRRKVTLPEYNFSDNEKLYLRIHHDEGCEVFINGVPIVAATGYTTGYTFFEVPQEKIKVLNWGGENTIAVHCMQTTGGQFIDVGISTVKILNNETALNNAVKKKISIFPNPTQNELRVENGEMIITNGMVEIYNIAGKMVKNELLKSEYINVSALQAGVYFLRLKAGNFQDVAAFIKN